MKIFLMYISRIFVWFVPFQKCLNGSKTRNILNFFKFAFDKKISSVDYGFLKQIWHSSYGFEKKRSQKGPTPKVIFFIFQDRLRIFLWIFLPERTNRFASALTFSKISGDQCPKCTIFHVTHVHSSQSVCALSKCFSIH